MSNDTTATPIAQSKMFKLEDAKVEVYKQLLQTNDDELSDKLFTYALLYICELLNLEKVRMLHKLQKAETSKQQVDECTARTIQRLTQVSFVYSKILTHPRYRCKGDEIKEKKFYDVCAHFCICSPLKILYKFTCKLIMQQFENSKMHAFIEAEVLRLFKSNYFIKDPKEQRVTDKLDIRQLYELKHVHKVKFPDIIKPKKHIHTASHTRSPLITASFPYFDKITFSTKHILERGFDALTFNLPAAVLLSNKQPAIAKNKPSDDEPAAQ